MSSRDEGPDESSVHPVSSLRSKFERLGSQLNNGRATPQQESRATISRNDTRPAIPRKPSLHSKSFRPVSMIEQPSNPESSMLQADDWIPARSSFEDRGPPHSFMVDDNNYEQARTRMPSRQELDKPKIVMESKDKATKSNAMQTIPATIKPQVPQKKPTLMAKLSEKATIAPPQASGQVSSVLPGVTQDTVNALPNFSPAMLKTRDRVNSDASWVERLRADSDASSHADLLQDASQSPDKSFANGRRSPKKMTRSARVQSNASWVETINSPVRDSPDEHHNQLAREIIEYEQETPMPSLPPRTSTWNSVDHPVTQMQSSISRPSPLSNPRVRADNESRTKLATSRNVDHEHYEIPSSAKQRVASSHEPVHPDHRTTNRVSSAASSTVSLNPPPIVPAPRRSLDRRKDVMPGTLSQTPFTTTHGQRESFERREEIVDELPAAAPTAMAQSVVQASAPIKINSDVSLSEKSYETSNLTFPDISGYNRRPPTWRQRPSQIHTEYDTRLLACSGDLVCTSGFITRVWDVRTGQQILSVVHPEHFKVTAIAFKSAMVTNAPSTHIWLGTNTGEVHELEIRSQNIIDTSQRAHKGREIVRIYAHKQRLWTLDVSGNLAVWKSGKDGSPSLQSHFQLFHTQKSHAASVVLGARLWIATGREIRVYNPAAATESEFQVGHISMLQMNIGEITSAAVIETHSELVYFGHTDGKISICNRQSMRAVSTVHVSLSKIGCLFGAGQYLWAGFGTGMIQVFDTSVAPWNTVKEWPAHSKQISNIACDLSSPDVSDSLRIVTLGADNIVKLWDGLFEDDWIEQRLYQATTSYCDFSELTASVLTWNAGAAKPGHLQHRIEDDNFLRDYIAANARCDIFVFGFQELVDLEDKKLTAKSFFKSKKKDAFEQEQMTHQYRAWQDHLTTRMREYAAGEFTNLHTASMIGLFTCIFVKSSLRRRIKHVHQAEIKRGMGGRYGNKGALVLRLVLDDSSMCFVNCHLAAGQTQTMSRNSDAAAILEDECLPAWPLDRNSEVEHSSVFTSGGDGSVVLDHELCILNGDLNYRIDTMGRDTVVKHVQQGNLARLLDRDQLLLSRKKNPGFKLRALQEQEIHFSPTYKYNVNSNEYDTSEKRRSPAWCDRILYRGVNTIRCDDYRRWEVRVSDHRPVSALLTCRVKRIDPSRQAKEMKRCLKEFKAYRQEVLGMARNCA